MKINVWKVPLLREVDSYKANSEYGGGDDNFPRWRKWRNDMRADQRFQHKPFYERFDQRGSDMRSAEMEQNAGILLQRTENEKNMRSF